MRCSLRICLFDLVVVERTQVKFGLNSDHDCCSLWHGPMRVTAIENLILIDKIQYVNFIWSVIERVSGIIAIAIIFLVFI
jgi:hypothetical protein